MWVVVHSLQYITVFNFGENMVNMVMTLLNGRKARVIMEEGYSSDIKIQRGTPQGDRASPFIFIIVIEVLLIKIRGMEGRGINECECLRMAIEGVDVEKLTAEAYADDLTLIFKMSEGAIRVILGVMDEFRALSGLSMNTNKTQLMICGTDEWGVGTAIHGITVVSDINVLGIRIDRKLAELDINWDNAITKMRRFCRFWYTFGLSISGRVMAVKTYIMSQAIYFMGVLPLPEQKGIEINDIITDYVRGGGEIIRSK